jgi:hypothetical protein
MVQPDAVRGGFVIKKLPTSLKTPDQEANITEATESAKSAVAYNDKIAADAAKAGSHNLRIDRMRQLLTSEEGMTGKGEDKLAAMRAYADRLGWADAAKSKGQQELDALLKREQLDIVNETMQKGTTSDRERELFATTVAGMEKDPKANLRLLELSRAANDKAIAAERHRQRLENSGLNERTIKKQMRIWINSDENSMENFIQKEERYTVNPEGNLILKPSTSTTAPAPTLGKLPSGWKIK